MKLFPCGGSVFKRMAFFIYFVEKKKSLSFILLVWLKSLITLVKEALFQRACLESGNKGWFTAAFTTPVLMWHCSLSFVLIS